jgi:hypothetical protein
LRIGDKGVSVLTREDILRKKDDDVLSVLADRQGTGRAFFFASMQVWVDETCV